MLLQLDLNDNLFSGSVNNSITAAPSLSRLSMYNNKLTGPFPTQWGGNLTVVYMGANAYDPFTPTELFNLPLLIQLSLSGAPVNQSEISAVVANASLPSLLTLSLRGSSLRGALPYFCTAMPNLSVLDLNSNGLTGDVHDGVNCPKLTSLSLGMNKSLKNVTSSFSNLTALLALGLEALNLTSFPQAVLNVPTLQSLGITDNFLFVSGSCGVLSSRFPF